MPSPLDNTSALRDQLGQINSAFAHITSTELPAINKELLRNSGRSLVVPSPTAFDDDGEAGAGGVSASGRLDPDARFGVEVPKNLRLWN